MRGLPALCSIGLNAGEANLPPERVRVLGCPGTLKGQFHPISTHLFSAHAASVAYLIFIMFSISHHTVRKNVMACPLPSQNATLPGWFPKPDARTSLANSVMQGRAIRYVITSSGEVCDVEAQCLPLPLYEFLHKQRKITMELYTCDISPISNCIPSPPPLTTSLNTEPLTPFTHYTLAHPFWNTQHQGGASKYFTDDTPQPQDFIHIPPVLTGRIVDEDKSNPHTTHFQTMALLKMLQRGRAESKRVCGWVIFPSESRPIDPSSIPHSLSNQRFPWNLFNEFGVELWVSECMPFERLAFFEAPEGQSEEVKKEDEYTYDTTQDFSFNLQPDKRYNIVRVTNNSSIHRCVWCLYVSSGQVSVTRKHEVGFYVGNNEATEVDLDIGKDPEAQKTYLLNVLENTKTRSNVMKLLLGSGPDEASTQVANEHPEYRWLEWPYMLTRGVWIWSATDEEVNMCSGFTTTTDNENNGNCQVPGMCITYDTRDIVFIDHYAGKDKGRQKAQDIMVDIKAKCGFMIKNILQFRQYTCICKLSVPENVFANSIRSLFGYSCMSYDRAERIYGTKDISPPAVYLKGPNNFPRGNFASLGNQFGDVLYCERTRRNMCEDTYLVFYKHPSSAKLLTGLHIRVKGSIMIGTSGDPKEDRKIKQEVCKQSGCKCQTHTTTQSCYKIRALAGQKLKTLKFTQTDLEALQCSFQSNVPKASKHPASDQIST